MGNQGFEFVEFEHVGRVGETAVGVGMHLEEEARGPESLGGQGHGGHKLAVAHGLAVAGRGPLHAVGAVHDDGGHQPEHVGDVAEIDHEIVVSEAVAALGEPHFAGAALACFLYGIHHVAAREELCLLDVDDAARACGGYEQVGLAAEKGRNLEHVAHFAGGLGLPGLVNVGGDAQVMALAHVGEHLQAALQARPAERVERGAVGLVERGLEDDVGAQAAVDGRQARGYGVEQLGRLDDTGAGDEYGLLFFHLFMFHLAWHAGRVAGSGSRRGRRGLRERRGRRRECEPFSHIRDA